MKWIDTTDIRHWASRRNCQDTLPELIRKLIRATSDSIESVHFPSGENVLIGGWDGVAILTSGIEYVPDGISVWEFGANSGVKAKADEDYEKRTKNPLGYNPAECTYVFVTPRLWTKREEWIEEKQKGGVWKDIKVIDAAILEEWLEIAPTVAAWLATKHLGKFRDGGIQSTEDFWEEWSSGPKLKLSPDLLLGGRESQRKSLLESVKEPSIVSVQATSREEALAFIVACHKHETTLSEGFFARSIIVDNEETFRKLSVITSPLILISRFEDSGVINRAVLNGHSVIVPLGADASDNWKNKIVLTQLERKAFVNALVNIGIPEEIAERYSKESVRNLTILRRQLEFNRNIPEWAKPEIVREILPALIVGRWDDRYHNDKNILAKLAGEDYEEHAKKLSRWLNSADSPLLKIGDTWRVASPLDAWANVSKYLTKNDFEILRSSFLEILGEINPAFEITPEQRHMSSFYGKERTFSGSIREGITQSLTLVSIFGNDLRFDLPVSGPLWVDGIIAELLSSDDPLLWKSIESKFPLLAEASPRAFLEAIEKNMPTVNSPVKSLFDEETGFLHSQSYHTGLLWALENLAWLPDYFSRSVLLLARIAAIDPGGSLSNRPINSLAEIFKPWHYQTNATSEARFAALNLICEREKEVGWTLLIRMLPEPHGVGQFTHRMRWRLFDQITEKAYTYNEIWETYSSAVDLLISICNKSEDQIATLIQKSVELRPGDRNKILEYVGAAIEEIHQVHYTTWHALRGILARHRSYPESPWALPEEILALYENVYNALAPNDNILKVLWLFDEHWPSFPEGFQRKAVSTDEHQILITNRRVEALTNIHKEYGLHQIEEIAAALQDPWILGDTLAYIIQDKKDIVLLCLHLENEGIDLRFIQAFVSRKQFLHHFDWVRDTYSLLKEAALSNHALAMFFVPVRQTLDLWRFIDEINGEVRKEYWLKIIPSFWELPIEGKILGLNTLIEHKRYFSAINVCYHYAEELPSVIVVEVLTKAAIDQASEDYRVRSNEIQMLFELFDRRQDVEPQLLLQLEWFYLPTLASYGYARSPKHLHKELAKNPNFFIEVFKWVYKSENDETNKEQVNMVDEQTHARGMQAYDLLRTWRQIPGLEDNLMINEAFLWAWIEQVRNFAESYGRLNTADAYIGEVLTGFPRNDAVWPPDAICKVIETINTDSLKNNFYTAIINSRGVTTRGAFEGGNQERVLANYYRNLSQLHQNRFPAVASIFEHLTVRYEEDAKKEDESAERDKLDY
ncbi:hypothetical protein EXU57_16665 [Segetibacter sp. 3557_3]|uniref:hypothetical protein n=1 Tax=Segetibacter sp. 3557_3 TaxID=2547429 RepID=UPI0010587B72|nr:hypothetical protein [Segetibacter sp. 3557_3]TDH23442.1 hypothetical protein EXU57_16665 [Segetibacter sp. 3557_3]